MKVLIADKFSEAHLDRLAKLGCEVTYNPTVKAEELPKIIGPFKVLIVRSKQVTGDTLKASDQLTVVLRAGAGVNTIDVKTASARGIYVANCPGKNSIAVAELVFALILALDRRVADNVIALRAGEWNKKEFSKARGLFGRVLGLVGLGSIAQEMIPRARAFGMPVVAWSRSLTEEKAAVLGIERRETPLEIAREADMVSVHVALKPDPRTLLGAAFFRAMKDGGYFLHSCR